MIYLLFASGLLSLISFLFIIIGLISPKASLFWYKKKQTRVLSTLIYLPLTFIFLIMLVVSSTNISSNEDDDPVTESPLEIKTDSLLRNGNDAKNKDQYSAAIAKYSEVINLKLDTSQSGLKTNLISAYTKRGECYEAQERYQLAINDYNSALNYDPNNSDYIEIRIGLYEDLNNYPLALKDANTLVQLDTSAEHHATRAELYKKMGNYAMAKKDYETALKTDQDNVTYLTAMASVLFDMSDYKGAFAAYNHLLKIDPNNAVALGNRGLAESYLGDNKQALIDINKSIAESPNNGTLYRGRGDIEVRSNLGNWCDDYHKAKLLGTDVDDRLKYCGH